ncbi:MAG: DUF4164 family protein [Alphaproteobacteria bacterium]|nr:DUF4164 family protein [Alphaproteobacteria bacterium]
MVQKQRKIGGLRGFMSKLDEAEQRLQRAVAGLEDAARVVVSSAQSNVATTQPDPQVAAELESAQARNAVLEDVNANVGQRLDDAIERIKTILEV